VTLLGTHPGADAQPTAWGARLQDLAVFDGRVFAGYGDWSVNTGPIAMWAWDLALGDWVDEGLLDTEGTWVLRVLGDRLAVPFIDTRDNTGDLAVRAIGSSTWTTHALGAGTAATRHCFDVASLDGTDLWAAGARRVNRDAAIWRSPSGTGGDWTMVHTAPSLDDRWMRFITLGLLDGQLFTSGYAMDDDGNAESFAGQAGDLGGWSAAAAFTFDSGGGVHRAGHRPLAFDGGLVRLRGTPHPFAASDVLWFDGTTLAVGPETARHLAVDDHGWLWSIDATGAVQLRTTWAGPTSTVVPGPADASCLAIDGDHVYVGTTSSELYVVDFTP
jgi:hypothetical protein